MLNEFIKMIKICQKSIEKNNILLYNEKIFFISTKTMKRKKQKQHSKKYLIGFFFSTLIFLGLSTYTIMTITNFDSRWFMAEYLSYAPVKSKWFKENAKQQIVDVLSKKREIHITNYQHQRNTNDLAYIFLTGLVQLGYKTTWENGVDTFNQFQKDNNINNTQDKITAEILLKLDELLHNQEKENISNVQKTISAYPNLKVELPVSCEYEPGMYYVGILEKTFEAFPAELRSSLYHLKLRCGTQKFRGLGGGTGENTHILIDGSYLMSKDKFLNLFVHEMAHIIDRKLEPSQETKLSIFTDNIEDVYISDPSIDFYSISFVDDTTRFNTAKREDFVSGYSTSNCFEDFAESLTAYVRYGENFRNSTFRSTKLKQKYNFFKEIIFKGKEFDTGWKGEIPRDLYDMTDL